MIEMKPEQVKSILQYIDSTQPENIKRDIFCQLGRECFRTGNTDAWVAAYQGHIQAFLDRVNLENKSPYWEKLEFNADRSILYLTGRKVQACACAFGDCEKPPVSLCQYCCKTYQENIFGMLFQRKVEVEITESRILGGERCSTAIHLL
jgi:hypothetical protein